MADCGRPRGEEARPLNKKTALLISLAAGILLLVALVLVQGSFHSGGGIRLPVGTADTDSDNEQGSVGGLDVLEITPSTVKPAINTLSRPVTYQRTQTVETFWNGGSGQSVSQVAVSGNLTRVDTSLPDGSVCDMLVTGGTAAVWYDDETEWTILHSEDFTADIAQRMLSYEVVRDLPVEDIAQADYRDLDGVSCIYVETCPDEAGYTDRYWVSVSSGLLYAAERLFQDEVVYRFTTTEPDAETPEDSLFRLPDGSLLPEHIESHRSPSPIENGRPGANAPGPPFFLARAFLGHSAQRHMASRRKRAQPETVLS